MKRKQKKTPLLWSMNRTSNNIGKRYGAKSVVTRVFCLLFIFVGMVAGGSLLSGSTVKAAAAECYVNQELYQNLYNQDTGEIIRGPTTTNPIECSEVTQNTNVNPQANKCYVMYELRVQDLAAGTEIYERWAKAINCEKIRTCADEHGGILTRVQPDSGGVRFAVADDQQTAASDEECSATQAEINANCPTCAAPDDIPSNEDDPEAVAFCRDEKGYTDFEYEGCILGYGGDTCELIVDNPTPAQQAAADACAVGRVEAGHGPPPGECGKKTNVLTNYCSSGIMGLLQLVLGIMTAGVGIVAVGGIAYGALLYTTAGGSQEQVKKAIGLIQNVVIGLVSYVALYAFLQFLIPGGVF